MSVSHHLRRTPIPGTPSKPAQDNPKTSRISTDGEATSFSLRRRGGHRVTSDRLSSIAPRLVEGWRPGLLRSCADGVESWERRGRLEFGPVGGVWGRLIWAFGSWSSKGPCHPLPLFQTFCFGTGYRLDFMDPFRLAMVGVGCLEILYASCTCRDSHESLIHFGDRNNTSADPNTSQSGNSMKLAQPERPSHFLCKRSQDGAVRTVSGLDWVSRDVFGLRLLTNLVNYC